MILIDPFQLSTFCPLILSFSCMCFVFFSKPSKFGAWGLYSQLYQVFLCLWALGRCAQSRFHITWVMALLKSGAEGPWKDIPVLPWVFSQPSAIPVGSGECVPKAVWDPVRFPLGCFDKEFQAVGFF